MGMPKPSGEKMSSIDKDQTVLTAIESEMADRLRQIMEHNRLELNKLQAAYLKSFTEAKTHPYTDKNTLLGSA